MCSTPAHSAPASVSICAWSVAPTAGSERGLLGVDQLAERLAPAANLVLEHPLEQSAGPQRTAVLELDDDPGAGRHGVGGGRHDPGGVVALIELDAFEPDPA